MSKVAGEAVTLQRLKAMAIPGLLSANGFVVGVIYLAAYAGLEWISFIGPYAHLGISPWNPGTGLSLALLLLFGLRMFPLLLISPVLADVLNQQFTMPWTIELSSSALVGGGYSIVSAVLLHPRLRFDPALGSMRDVVLLSAAAVIGAALVGTGYVALTVAGHQLPAQDFLPASLQYWVGDVIGIIVVAPFALFVLTRRRMLPMTLEALLQFVAIALALLLVFRFPHEQQFQLFYLLFLPIVWLAVRAGSEGVSVGILATQLGLIFGIQLVGAANFNVTAFQALMLVLAVTGLVAGELVTERRRTESQLRLQQEQLARLARLGSMGELAAAVAHELNQPLMAAGTYTRLVNDAVGSGDTGVVAEAARKALVQVERAADVVRHLRALVRLDRSNRAPCSFARIAEETIELCRPDLERAHVAVRTFVPTDLPQVMVDLLQIEQVLSNLLRNAIEAISGTGAIGGTVLIEAKVIGPDVIEIGVRDSGPGFRPQFVETAFLPLSTTKSEGLGIGLSLCKSIVEAHGGKLWLNSGSQGGDVRFTLPISETAGT